MASYGAFDSKFEQGPSLGSFNVVVNRHNETNERRKIVAMIPLLLLGLMAAACLVSTAEWDGDSKQTSLAIGASEEGEAQKAIAIAKSIGKDEVTAKSPPVDPKILKEVEKAEAEMKHETMTEEAYASGKEAVSMDGTKTKKVKRPDGDEVFKALKPARLSAPKTTA
mmetsp:Transcript_19823/g.47259  ORF Transcript_19823/g.47259 Transcript_19823/m.47259 type:complete len:167 (-) Transcript_19823:183-683(-)